MIPTFIFMYVFTLIGFIWQLRQPCLFKVKVGGKTYRTIYDEEYYSTEKYEMVYRTLLGYPNMRPR